MRRFAQLLLLALLTTAAAPAWAQGDRMQIDYIDSGKYEKSGLIRYYVDILNRDNEVIPDQDRTKLEFLVNDDPFDPEIIGNVEVKQFDDIGEPVAVGILFTNYGGFIPATPGEPSLFKFSKLGIIQFMSHMRQSVDWTGLWLYNENPMEAIVPFTRNIEGASDVIKELEEERIIDIDNPDDDSGSDRRRQTPNFYRDLETVVKKMADIDDLPRRRMLLVISDGVGEFSTTQKTRIDDKLKRIIETANDNGIKIYTFGAILADDAFLPFLGRLAERTYGVYSKVAEPEGLEGAIRDLGPQLKKQYVIDLTVVPPGLPSEETVKLRIDAETPNGERVSSTYAKPLKFKDFGHGAWYYIKIVLWVLGGIIGFFFLIWLIKKIVGAMKNRPQAEEAEYEEDEAYAGPDRGKLTCRTGAQAGVVFPLIEDITTIGSIEGNHVVLYDDGVSKRHAGIKIEEMRYELADFGSTNGTWVNGRKINKQFLRDGDDIRIGNTEMSFTLK